MLKFDNQDNLKCEWVFRLRSQAPRIFFNLLICVLIAGDKPYL
jgi:hypothetical protein